MISYAAFWETLRRSHESTTVTLGGTTTINDLCRILGCDVDGVMHYIPSEEDQPL